MTKLLLSAICVLFISPAIACKPAPLESCKKFNFRVDQTRYENLVNVVNSYQGILYKRAKTPKRASSCYKSGFALFYAERLQDSLKKHKSMTCKEQITQVRDAINALISNKSAEMVTITNTSDKKHLKREAKKVKIAMLALP